MAKSKKTKLTVRSNTGRRKDGDRNKLSFQGFECLQINKTLELGKVTHLLPFPTLWDFGRKTKE